MDTAKDNADLGDLAQIRLVRVSRPDIVLSNIVSLLFATHITSHIVGPYDDLPRRVCMSSRYMRGRVRCT